MLPDVPGPLCLGHPTMCRPSVRRPRLPLGRACFAASTAITLGPTENGRAARYASRTTARSTTYRTPLVVGADGRGSSIRKQAGIALHRDPTHHLFAGLLVEGADDWPATVQEAPGSRTTSTTVVFPQGNGRVRLYLGYALEQRRRLGGTDAAERFLAAYRLAGLPGSAALAGARPAGPCHAYGNEDTWTDAPVADGVVLIGDAAGHNDPIIGQGLSITLRDVRLVRDVLLAERDWSPRAFFLTSTSAASCMRRLVSSPRSTATTRERVRSRRRGPRARAPALDKPRTPMLVSWFLAAFAGPDAIPAEAFDDSVRTRLLAPA